MYYGLNRTLCDVLKEIRKCDETKNYSVLLSLTEEAQLMGNRMEAALYDIKDVENLREKLSKLKKEHKKLDASIKKLEERKEYLEELSESLKSR
jgi:cell division protein FtsB